MIGDKYPEKTAEEVTRREWLLQLGEIIALAGASGLVSETATVLAEAEEQASIQLPPGLYEPSSKHLVMALSGSEELHSRTPGSPTEYVLRSGVFAPRFFTADEFRVITCLMETLLGKVDPGALAETAHWFDLWLYSAKVVREAAGQLDPLHRALAIAYFGETSVRELESAEPEAVVRSGMAALEQSSHARFGRGFVELSEPQQLEVIRTGSTAPANSPLRKLLDLTRHEAIRGFYTSRAGLKELDYQGNAYLPDCPGCEIKTGADGKGKT